MKKLHIYSLLALFLGTQLKSTEVSLYRQELKTFKQSEEYKDIFDKNIPYEIKYLQRDLELYKNTNFGQRFLYFGFLWFMDLLSPIVVTNKSMPKLYTYIQSICQNNNIKTPIVLLTSYKGFYNALAAKILASSGCVLIGQDIILKSSDEEIEGILAHEIGHIKHNHSNKSLALNLSIGFLSDILLKDKEINPLDRFFIKFEAYTASKYFSKYFEKQADQFAFQQGKAKGLKKIFKKLQNQWENVDTKLIETKKKIRKGKKEIGNFNYSVLMFRYYLVKSLRLFKKFDKWLSDNTLLGTHPSHKERINAARIYLRTHVDA